MDNADVDAILTLLLEDKRVDMVKEVKASSLIALAHKAEESFKAQPVLLKLKTPVAVCGDIHGQFRDLIRIFNRLGFPPYTNYLFLGDYVDRGPMSLECICLLFCYKVKHPENIFLLRGNHETASTNGVYGFRQEIDTRYGNANSRELWKTFNHAFAHMPLTALIGERILAMHGGLSPLLREFRQLQAIQRGWLDPAENSLEMDVLWSDPRPGIRGWRPNERGVSYTFGDDIIPKICKRMELDLIVRAHQVVQDGYELHDSKQLITLFSAPNYCGEFNNAGAVMYVDQKMSCSFIRFLPAE